MATETEKPLISGHKLSRAFGDRPIHRSLTFRVLPRDRVGIVGRNGCGKSTFLRILAGQDDGYEGNLVAVPGLEIGFVAQEPELELDRTVEENIDLALAPVRALLTRYDAVNERFGEELAEGEMDALLAEQDALQEAIDLKEAWDLDRRVEVARAALDCPPPTAIARTLSGGERRRVALCGVLMLHPQVLLLDEPTNHLDPDAIEWLEEYLKSYQGAFCLVTHDRYFLDRTVSSIWELEGGYGYGYPGNYSRYIEAKAEQVQTRKKADRRQKKRYLQELEWVRKTPKARATKNRARLKAFDQLQKDVETQAEDGRVDLFIPTGPPLSQLVVRAEGLCKSFGEKVLYRDLDFELPRGGIVGVTGPNGSGKTTLLKILMGLEEPDAGIVERGKRTTFCYVDQWRETLDPEKTVYDEVSGGNEWIYVGKQAVHIRSYLARFNFSGKIQQTKVGKLSGGERNRLQLAKLLRGGGNVVVLDEPTNDLDLETLHILEEALLQFPGSAVVISHDRYFLDRIATHILAFRGEGIIDWCEGNYQTYRTWLAARERDGDIEMPARRKRIKMVR